MIRSLARLPIVVAGTAVRQGFNAAMAGVELLRHLRGGDDDQPPAARPQPAAPRSQPTETPAAAPTPQRAAPPRTPPRARSTDGTAARRAAATTIPQAAPPPPTPAEPRHVSREATQVASFGPSDDPGATVHVAAPWDGYDRQPAAEVVRRVREADDTTRAAVALYEQANKKRRTVLEAAATTGGRSGPKPNASA